MGKFIDFLTKQREDWKGLRKAEGQYPNSFAVFASNFSEAAISWGIAAIVALCYGALGLMEERWPEITRNEFLVSACIIVAILAALYALKLYLYRQFSKTAVSGYLAGLLVGAVILAFNVNDLLLLSSSAVIAFFADFIFVRVLVLIAVHLFGPFQVEMREKAKAEDITKERK